MKDFNTYRSVLRIESCSCSYNRDIRDIWHECFRQCRKYERWSSVVSDGMDLQNSICLFFINCVDFPLEYEL